MTEAKHESNLELTKDIPHHAFTGELCGVYLGDLEEKRPCYNEFALYIECIMVSSCAQALILVRLWFDISIAGTEKFHTIITGTPFINMG